MAKLRCRLTRCCRNLALALFACVCLSAQDSAPSVVRMAGSELLGDSVPAAFTTVAEELGIKLRHEFKGSRLAYDQLATGNINFAILIEDPAGKPLPEDWLVLPLAHAVAWVVVRADVAIEQLSFADLTLIYGADSPVASPRWGDFGATGSWESVPVDPQLVTAAEGMSHEIFVHMALNTPAVKHSVDLHDHHRAALHEVVDKRGALAVVPWIPEDVDNVKQLLIAPGDDGVAFGPTDENLMAGDYPLKLTLRLVVPRSQVAELLPLLLHWYGEEGTVALTASQLTPLSRTERNQQIFELEAAAGQP